jgi:hypothetical protein
MNDDDTGQEKGKQSSPLILLLVSTSSVHAILMLNSRAGRRYLINDGSSSISKGVDVLSRALV